MKKYVVILLQIGLFILTIIITILGLEVGYRSYIFLKGGDFFREKKIRSPFITTHHKPAPLFYKYKGGYFKHRKELVPFSKPPGEFRIICLGGSTTLNGRVYVKYKVDYPLLLEKLLNKDTQLKKKLKIKYFKVLNCGGDYYSTAHSLVNFSLRIIHFSPDLIIIMHSINDFSVNFFKGTTTFDYANKYLNPVVLPTEFIFTQFPHFFKYFYIFTYFKIYNYLCKKMDIYKNENYLSGIRADIVLKAFVSNLKSIIAIAIDRNIRVVLLTQPHIKTTPLYTHLFKEYSEAIKKLVKNSQKKYKNKIFLIDMADKIGQTKEYFCDNVHYTLAGIKKFSGVLYEELRNQLLNEKP